MASNDKPTSAQVPPPPRGGGRDCFFMDVVLRFSVFATTLAAVLLMVTGNQTELIPYPANPLIRVPVRAKFVHSPAFIYFIAALSTACLYSIITLLASFCASCRPVHRTKFSLHAALFDVVVLGLVASATGTAGGVAYIGLKGNSHVNWAKICNTYDSFCRHIGIAVALSLAASVLLLFLVWRSICSVHRKINHY